MPALKHSQYFFWHWDFLPNTRGMAVLAAVVLLEDVLRKQGDQAGDTLAVEVRAGVDAGQEAAEFVRVRLLQKFEGVVEDALDRVRLGVLEDVRPAGFLGDDESARGAVLVGVGQDAGAGLRVLGEVVALRVGEQPLEFLSAALIAQREEPEKDDGQDVPLIVGGLDRAAQVHGGLPQLFQ